MSNATAVISPARFPLGRVCYTPGAQAALDAAGVRLTDLLARHQSGDWGELSPDDVQANADALRHGWRVLSAYPVGEARIWVITEADRSLTTLLLPEEY